MKVYTFGDSWGAGWGLKKQENNFTDYLGKELGCKTENHSESGSSLGQITHEFVCQHEKFSPGDLVIVIVPPDTRWYTQQGSYIRSMFDQKSSEYKNFLKGKTDYWFIYHHSLFMHAIYNICNSKKVFLILAHNYGDLVLLQEFRDLIPKKIFLDFEKSLTSLLGTADWKDNYTVKHNGPPNPFIGPYFIKNDTHPNEQGHKKIAELLLNKFRYVK